MKKYTCLIVINVLHNSAQIVEELSVWGWFGEGLAPCFNRKHWFPCVSFVKLLLVLSTCA